MPRQAALKIELVNRPYKLRDGRKIGTCHFKVVRRGKIMTRSTDYQGAQAFVDGFTGRLRELQAEAR